MVPGALRYRVHVQRQQRVRARRLEVEAVGAHAAVAQAAGHDLAASSGAGLAGSGRQAGEE